MRVRVPSAPRRRRDGFTLLEILVAVVIMALCFLVVWRTFMAALDGLTRGQKFMENLHHGDYVIEQLVGALRSSAFYDSRKDKYGFWLNDHSGQDAISWVTSSSAFMGPRSVFKDGLHRVEVLIDDDDEGRPSFTVKAWSQLAEEEEDLKPEVWHISSRIVGLGCEVYNPESQDWEHEWENTNAVPRLVKVKLELTPLEKNEPTILVNRIIEIPIGPPLEKGVSSTGGGSTSGGATTGGSTTGGGVSGGTGSGGGTSRSGSTSGGSSTFGHPSSGGSHTGGATRSGDGFRTGGGSRSGSGSPAGGIGGGRPR